jgi:hypothetical protein
MYIFHNVAPLSLVEIIYAVLGALDRVPLWHSLLHIIALVDLVEAIDHTVGGLNGTPGVLHGPAAPVLERVLVVILLLGNVFVVSVANCGMEIGRLDVVLDTRRKGKRS